MTAIAIQKIKASSAVSRYQSSSVPLTGPRSNSASAFCSWAAAGATRAEARPAKRNCLRRNAISLMPTGPASRLTSGQAALQADELLLRALTAGLGDFEMIPIDEPARQFWS